MKRDTLPSHVLLDHVNIAMRLAAGTAGIVSASRPLYLSFCEPDIPSLSTVGLSATKLSRAQTEHFVG